MWYVIYSRERENVLDVRLKTRPDHLEYAKKLLDEGRMLLAGPRPVIDSPDPGPAGFQGSLIVAEFDSLGDARAWADNDPYMLAGVFESVEVSPFIKVLPL